MPSITTTIDRPNHKTKTKTKILRTILMHTVWQQTHKQQQHQHQQTIAFIIVFINSQIDRIVK
ncbi:hypothetical protein DERP_008162 [Dermatophagoides pteronyssinus]|uniref:Uncharacterized protein n=1 Tax=Dermatophagoides pteronyssinus TaxID=6956 RepID=A0ABQ8JJW3_DERPT|nr:hypothetical protein DERP_008162 [Dermatophagoides pteronyssinus]